MNKPPSKRRSGSKSTGKTGTPPPAGSSRPAKGGRGPGKSTAKKPGWLPEPPPRGTRPPPLAPLHGDPAQGGGGLRDPYAAREAARYEQPIASREMILQLLVAADGPLDAEALAGKLGLTEPERFDAMSARLRAMVRDGQVLQNRRGGYVPAEQLDLVAGSVIANPDGFGFLRPEAGGDDMFLPPYEMRKVMHGDRVLASVTGVDHRGRQEGVIVEVLERRLSRMIGRFILEDDVSYVEPDDRRIQRNILIPPEARGDAQPGNLVVCELTRSPDARRPPLGRILTVLGDRLTASLAVQAAIHGHDIPHEFPPEVLDQAAAIPVEVQPAEIASRVDLRELPLVTIDGEDAKDFDDAVWCEPNRDGFRLVVAIADVSHYVRPGQSLDEEAQKRATSVYFPGFVVPMLPEVLSNGICSLKPKVDRLCFVCDMQVDRSGQVTGSKFYEAVMNSHARLTYNQVWNAIGDGIEDHAREEALEQVGSLLPNLQRMHQLYQVLAKARAKRGAIEFETSEVRFVLGERGEVVQAGMLVRNDAHKLIEECMIAANVEAARFLIEAEVSAPYRTHDRPPEQKYEDLLEFLKEFQLRMPPWSKVQPRDFTQLLRNIRERPDAPLIESVLLRSQSLAVYQPENIGHFGLALEAYAHFTSPIRRYPDLLVHRAIKHALSGAKPEKFRYSPSDMAQLSLQSSERGRRADEASREVDERYRAAWMEQHVGSQFDGVVSGVTSFGLFVELDDSKVNGLIHVTQLPNDYYRFDPIRKALTGERTGREFRLGDRASIIVMKASLEERKIDFRLAGENGGVKPPPPRGEPAKRKKQKY
ncbi:exoribonuclease R [Lysobacter concretionis Ko07 = DSM 16239]|uniref:Ribonuclease R n=1 Tax=Lysobacter concretionis Ko07 = DSM 16239 TaxID=1122185 RepID=A0A0A0EQ83_9GAMM|nr:MULTISPECIES: ribonuclease R [Lysobacter]KGM52345.1 exoribonuclease R [Lysobacter concretionis Ko07 = DSM 16239]QOD91916.1 ribonuclease R [Lysobacter sp. CW239]